MKSCWLILVLIVLPALAQEGKQHFTINVGTPEGQMLQAIGQEMDDSKKVPLMQEFLDKYPKHEGASWVSGQLQVYYSKQKDYDNVIDAGEKGLASDPNDLDLAYNNLKAAEGKGDPDLVKVWSGRTSANARKITGSGKPPADDDEKQLVEYAKQVDTYSEYAVSAAAGKAQDPKKVVELVESLEQRNPKSQYLAQASAVYLADLGKAGQAGKACGAAERLAAANSKDVDALIFAGQCGLQPNRFDRAVTYANKALEALASRSDADLGSRKVALTARANWIAGVAYGSQGKYGPANKALRAALPAIKGDPQLAAAAFFHLGLANYSLGKAIGDKSQTREGLQFFQQCAEIKSNYQDQAEKNVRTIRAELGVR
jgi:tetratricopeptide (TPR) repeat protein